MITVQGEFIIKAKLVLKLLSAATETKIIVEAILNVVVSASRLTSPFKSILTAIVVKRADDFPIKCCLARFSVDGDLCVTVDIRSVHEANPLASSPVVAVPYHDLVCPVTTSP